jgi:hypothetical protein
MENKNKLKMNKNNKLKINRKHKGYVVGCLPRALSFTSSVRLWHFKLEAPVFSSLAPKRMNSSYCRVIPNVYRSG